MFLAEITDFQVKYAVTERAGEIWQAWSEKRAASSFQSEALFLLIAVAWKQTVFENMKSCQVSRWIYHRDHR